MEREGEKKPGVLQRAVSAIGGIICVLLCLMLICNLTIIIKGTLYPEQPPSVVGITPLVVKSGSMSGSQEGHIEVGDLIFVGPVEAKTLQVGDVIAYKEGRIVVTHRITAIQTDEEGKLQFTTKGDANNAEDQNPVSEENLVGIYKTRIPKVGDFAMFLQTPLGMVLFIGVPVMGFIVYDIIRRQRYARRERRNSEALEAELARLRAQAERVEQPPEKSGEDS